MRHNPSTPLLRKERVSLCHHDAFKQPYGSLGGLGRGAGSTWESLLTSSPSTPKNLAAVRGVTVRTIHRHLAALSAVGLAEKTKEGWRGLPADKARLDEIARTLGAAGRGARQRLAHDLQRQGFREYLQRAKRSDAA